MLRFILAHNEPVKETFKVSTLSKKCTFKQFVEKL